MSNVTISVASVKIGRQYIAAANLNGISVRGQRAEDEALAIRNCLFAIANGDDGALGIELLLTGDTVGDAFTKALGLGTGASESDDAAELPRR